MNKYQAIANLVDPCKDCWPIKEWEAMTEEELEAIGLDPRNLPSPPAKTWEACYPWLVIKCEGCGKALAEFDAAEKEEDEVWY